MKRLRIERSCQVLILAACLVGLTATWGQASNTFTNSGDWMTAANWSSGTVPGDGEDVIINANVTLTNATAALASYTLNAGKTNTFVGWSNTVLTATVVNVSGTITHTNESATTTNALGAWIPDMRVYIVCSNLTVYGSGKIDANGKGYRGGVKTPSAPSCGPGAGTNGTGGGSLMNAGAGAGYGGFGGPPTGNEAKSGKPYGTAAAPSDPGSGGGTGDGNGGAGGGAIRIEATGEIAVSGGISADGIVAPGAHGGGGSGGSVYLACRTISGTGTVSAVGGPAAATTGCGGGGGRIAVLYDTSAQVSVPGIKFTTAPGLYTGSYSAQMGDVGTLYMTNSLFLTETIVGYGGEWAAPDMSALNAWSVNNLTLSNAWLRFPTTGFALTVANGAVVHGTNAFMNRLELTNGTMTCGGNLLVTNAGVRLYAGASATAPSLGVGGNLTLYGGQLRVWASSSSWVASGYGARVMVVGDLTVLTNSIVYPYSHPTNGNSVFFSCNNLTVDAGGSINADTLGYWGGLRTNASPAKFRSAYGPGAGTNGSGAAAVRAGGGAYGGSGGMGTTAAGGTTYGDLTAPTAPGSGGGANDSVGAAGGGAVRLAVTNLALVNGTITANGGSIAGGGGAGAGGGIYITCAWFAGTNGVIKANGGDSSASSAYGGGGGGGRIAVIYDPAMQNGKPVPQVQFSARGGDGGLDGWLCGDVGTLYFPDNQWLTETIPHSGQWSAPGLTAWAPNRLTVTNAWLRFVSSGLQFSATNEITVVGTNPIICRLEFTNAASVQCGGNLTVTNASFALYRGPSPGSTLTCGGDLTFGNSGTKLAKLAVYSGPTNSPTPGYGALVSVAGNFTVGSNCWVIPYSDSTNGGAALFQMRNLTVSGGGGFKADAGGYAGGVNVGWTTYYLPYGPGKGGNGTGGGTPSNAGGGGGYGGVGGGPTGRGGGMYGSSNAPVDSGSGGGSGDSGRAGNGGGVVRIVARDTIDVRGTLSANGEAGLAAHSGGGAGGSVYLICKRFSGTSSGRLLANGGNGNGTDGGGGGGGRIAVWSLRDLSGGAVSNSAVKGTTGTGNPGGTNGTVVFGLLSPPGTVVFIR